MRYVYLIQHGDLFKIGNSANPRRRLWQVVPSNAVGASVVHQFPSNNAGHVERALHRRFHHCRVVSEWFRLAPDDVELFCRLGKTDTIDDLPPEMQPTPRPNMAILFAEIPADLKLRIVHLAEARGTTISEVVRQALKEYLDTDEARADLAAHAAAKAEE